MPKISILLPNLNHRPFLQERLDCIFGQTFTDWELIVVDNHSDDGAWELFQQQACTEPRLRIFQARREGIYANWNNCLELAQGEFVYIATSDDTMKPDCLKNLLAALESHPECGLAHCCLEVIDEKGNEVEGALSWKEQPVPKFFFGSWMDRPHIRTAPHDGILHAATGTVYTSITQMLIRRSVFEHVGSFRNDWGSAGDFEWGMRASLLYSTVHVPEVLASWRRHPGQLTQDQKSAAPENRRKMAEMVSAALHATKALNPRLHAVLSNERMTRPFRHQAILLEKKETGFKRFVQWLKQMVAEPDLIIMDLQNRFLWKGRFHRFHLHWIQKEMARLGTPALRETK